MREQFTRYKCDSDENVGENFRWQIPRAKRSIKLAPARYLCNIIISGICIAGFIRCSSVFYVVAYANSRSCRPNTLGYLPSAPPYDLAGVTPYALSLKYKHQYELIIDLLHLNSACFTLY